MFSTQFLLHTALLVLAFLCLQMLRRIGSGRDIVRIARRSSLDPETAWGKLLHAWRETGLTFQPARIDDVENGSRIVRQQAGGEIVLMPLSPPTEYSVIFRVLSVDGDKYLPGIAHFEHWRIEPAGTGSRVIIETRFRSTLLGAIRSLWGLWQQAGVVASSRQPDTFHAPTDNAGFRSAPGARANPTPIAAPRRPAPISAGYGRELMMSLLAFAYLLTQLSWQSAVVLAGVILWHEYGHLLAYQMTGRKGNRMMLVPFFGGIAVASAPHRNELERAFCALMGPGICAPLSLGAYALWYYGFAPDYDQWFWRILYFSALLNLLNLLPIYPLDGGQAAESFLRSFLPGSIFVHLSGLAVVGIVVLVGFEFYEMALFVGLFSLFGLRSLPHHSPLPAMTGRQALAMAMFYAVTVGAHGFVFYQLTKLID